MAFTTPVCRTSFALPGSQQLQQPLASRQHILPGGLKVAGVPGIFDIAGMVCIVHQQMQLPGEVAAADVVHIPQVGPIHPNQQIVLIVIGVGELPRRFASAVDAVFGQLAPRRGIDRVADLLRAGGGGLDVELGFQSGFFHQVFHHELGHRAPTDIPMAHEKDARHCSHTP